MEDEQRTKCVVCEEMSTKGISYKWDSENKGFVCDDCLD